MPHQLFIVQTPRKVLAQTITVAKEMGPANVDQNNFTVKLKIHAPKEGGKNNKKGSHRGSVEDAFNEVDPVTGAERPLSDPGVVLPSDAAAIPDLSVKRNDSATQLPSVEPPHVRRATSNSSIGSRNSSSSAAPNRIPGQDMPSSEAEAEELLGQDPSNWKLNQRASISEGCKVVTRRQSAAEAVEAIQPIPPFTPAKLPKETGAENIQEGEKSEKSESNGKDEQSNKAEASSIRPQRIESYDDVEGEMPLPPRSPLRRSSAQLAGGSTRLMAHAEDIEEEGGLESEFPITPVPEKQVLSDVEKDFHDFAADGSIHTHSSSKTAASTDSTASVVSSSKLASQILLDPKCRLSPRRTGDGDENPLGSGYGGKHVHFLHRGESTVAVVLKEDMSELGDEEKEGDEEGMGLGGGTTRHYEEVDIEDLVRGALDTMKTEGYISYEPTFLYGAESKHMMICFVCDAQWSHMIVSRLEHIGVGSDIGSVGVVPLEIARGDERHHADVDTTKSSRTMDQQKFMAIASQIRVEQVIEQISEQARFSFDYLCLLLVANFLAAIGLATNNTVVIVASMLVSPIMGPVLGFTFGSTVHDWDLRTLGMRTELLSLVICTVTGFVTGIIGIPFLSSESQWPTPEMESRGQLDNLLVGIGIAIPSGVGVALSLLGNNTSSLVGVAISASLLPPAVNCGLLWCYAALGPAIHPDFDIDGRDLLIQGAISMILTIENIICIYLASVLTFKIKEVAPLTNKSSFWREDILRSRKFHDQLTGLKTAKGRDAQALAKRVQSALRRFSHSDVTGNQNPLHTLSAQRSKHAFEVEDGGAIHGDERRGSEVEGDSGQKRGNIANLPSVFDIFQLNEDDSEGGDPDDILSSISQLFPGDQTTLRHRRDNRSISPGGKSPGRPGLASLFSMSTPQALHFARKSAVAMPPSARKPSIHQSPPRKGSLTGLVSKNSPPIGPKQL